MKKYLFFDVDGTLLNSKKQLPENTVEAIEKARANGHEIAIATGRAPFMIQHILKQLNIETYVCFNGQYVVHKNELVFTDKIDDDTLAEVVHFADGRKESVAYFNADVMIASYGDDERVEKSLASIEFPYPKVAHDFYKSNPVYQTLLFVDEEGEQIYAEKFPALQIVRWHPFSCDLLPKNGSKARGIQKLAEHLNVSVADIVVFGDGLNDVEMLQFAGIGVAMGNGHEKALQVADYVTKHVDEDGISFAMQQLKLI